MAVALVLVTRAAGASSSIEGLFVAAWSGPSLMSGVIIGHGLDHNRHPRRFLCTAGLLAGATLALDATLLGHVPTTPLLAVTAIGGVTIPLFTGGVSSLLPNLTSADLLNSAQALDSATYSASGIIGPALVALLAATFSPRAALLLPAVAVTAGAVILPVAHRADPLARTAQRPSLRSTLAALGNTSQLLTATAASTISAFGWGGLEIGAVAIAALTSSAHLAGIYLATLGATALLAALLLARFPLGRPDLATPITLLTMATGGLLIALGRSALLIAFGFAVVGVGDGVLLPAVLAVRSRDAPPGMSAAVFTTAASFKTAATAAGAAIAGLALAILGARGLFLALAATQLLAGATAARSATTTCRKRSQQPA